MKKYLLIMFVAMLTISLSTTAQNKQAKQDQFNNNRGKQTMRMTAKERVEWMSKEIELTDAQKVEVEALLQKQDEKRTEDIAKHKEIRRQNAENRDNMRAMRTEEMKKNQEELEKIIGKENSDKLNNLRKERRETNRQERRK